MFGRCLLVEDLAASLVVKQEAQARRRITILVMVRVRLLVELAAHVVNLDVQARRITITALTLLGWLSTSGPAHW